MPSLYICSSTFHVLVASLHASNSNTPPYFAFLRNTAKQSDFYTSLLTKSGIAQSKNRFFIPSNHSRLSIGKDLFLFFKNKNISKVFVGNDRHIEFQKLAHLLGQPSPVSINYLDEGLYSYLGRNASKSFGDKYIDHLLKKIFVGRWWDTPVTIGASKWINESHLFYPDLANNEILKKPIEKINTYKNKEFLTMMGLWVKQNGNNNYPDSNLKIVFALPDLKNIETYSLKETIHNELQKLVSESPNEVSAKYHPNTAAEDPLHLKEKFPSLHLIKKDIPLEPMLALGHTQALYSTMSTVLLSAVFFNPDIKVFAINHTGDKNNPLLPILKKLNISIIQS